MLPFKKNLSDFVVCDTLRIEDDLHIGIPYEVTLLFDKKNGDIIPGIGGTPIILYVINTNTERVGQDADTEIIGGMLRRGYAVLVIDYLSEEKACPPALDWSIQNIRRKVMGGDIDGIFTLPDSSYPETFVVPAGYDVSLSMPYWAFDKHGADGILEKITEIWNNDFRGTKGDVLIKWCYADGTLKPLANGLDGTEPMRYRKDGTECENGEYAYIKHTLARDITDCVKPDGSPIDLNLYMHVIYPKSPGKPVPVMCLAGSTEHLASGAATQDRPQLNGAAFRGYACVMIDYGYTPMARADHYGYFDGYPKKGYVTGDNATYSMSFYNDKRIFCAAMRYIRYLALSEPERYVFDTDAIGIYGNSKGSWMTFLGEKEPEKLPSKRMLAGHHDETRFDNGHTEACGTIRGGEEQPWQFFGDLRIKSEAEFIYSSCGGLHDSITDGHSPMFISCNRTDSSCYSTSNTMLAACRAHNVPCMWVDIPLPHTLVYGNDLLFNTDTYSAFFAFTGYYLHHDSPRALCARADISAASFTLKLRFSGGIPESEMAKVKIADKNGNELCGKWRGELGGIDWSFTPSDIAPNTDYILTVPDSILGDNGKALSDKFTYAFSSPAFEKTAVPIEEKASGEFLADVPLNASTEYKYLEFLSEGGCGFAICTEDGQILTRVFTNADGRCLLPLHQLSPLTSGKLLIKPIGDKFDSSSTRYTPCKRAIIEDGKAPDGTPAIVIKGFESVTEHPTEEFYSYPAAAVRLENLLGDTPVSVSDIGRRFNIRFRLYDTSSRYVNLDLSHVTSRENSITDHRRGHMNLITKANEWIEASIDYTVYEPIYTDLSAVTKSMTVSTYGSGNIMNPLYIADVHVTEYIGDAKGLSLSIITDTDKISALPEGKLDIVCEKSPWQK